MLIGEQDTWSLEFVRSVFMVFNLERVVAMHKRLSLTLINKLGHSKC